MYEQLLRVELISLKFMNNHKYEKGIKTYKASNAWEKPKTILIETFNKDEGNTGKNI